MCRIFIHIGPYANAIKKVGHHAYTIYVKIEIIDELFAKSKVLYNLSTSGKQAFN